MKEDSTRKYWILKKEVSNSATDMIWYNQKAALSTKHCYLPLSRKTWISMAKKVNMLFSHSLMKYQIELWFTEDVITFSITVINRAIQHTTMQSQATPKLSFSQYLFLTTLFLTNAGPKVWVWVILYTFIRS